MRTTYFFLQKLVPHSVVILSAAAVSFTIGFYLGYSQKTSDEQALRNSRKNIQSSSRLVGSYLESTGPVPKN